MEARVVKFGISFFIIPCSFPPYILLKKTKKQKQPITRFFLPWNLKIYFIFGNKRKEVELGLWGLFFVQNISDIMEWPESCFLLKDTWQVVIYIGQPFLILPTTNNTHLVLSSFKCSVKVQVAIEWNSVDF